MDARQVMVRAGETLAKLPRPFVCAARKVRFSRYKDAGGALASAVIRGRLCCQDPACDSFIASNGNYLKHYARSSGILSAFNYFRPTATVIEIGAIESAPDYVRAVSKASRGNDTRIVAKARRLGYTSERLAQNAYSASVLAIQRSKLIRSRGVMLDAAIRPDREAADTRRAFVPPRCPEHWNIDWGAFSNAKEGRRLVAHAALVRSGDLINLVHFMGHGDFHHDGVVKMLMMDVMQWLIEKKDANVQGVRYFLYGAIEHGGRGLSDWKRYIQFRPVLLDIATLAVSALPSDFDPSVYLKLNPDLRAANADPRAHYLYHGVHEGRRYR